jgi:hypothetical protein
MSIVFSTNEVFAHPGEEARPICRLCFVFFLVLRLVQARLKRSDVLCIQSGFWIGISTYGVVVFFRCWI